MDYAPSDSRYFGSPPNLLLGLDQEFQPIGEASSESDVNNLDQGEAISEQFCLPTTGTLDQAYSGLLNTVRRWQLEGCPEPLPSWSSGWSAVIDSLYWPLVNTTGDQVSVSYTFRDLQLLQRLCIELLGERPETQSEGHSEATLHSTVELMYESMPNTPAISFSSSNQGEGTPGPVMSEEQSVHEDQSDSETSQPISSPHDDWSGHREVDSGSEGSYSVQLQPDYERTLTRSMAKSLKISIPEKVPLPNRR